MSRSKKTTKKKSYGIKSRKMKPYCLTGDKKIRPSYIESGASYENHNGTVSPQGIKNAKKEREDYKIERKTEKHSTRQQAKKKIRKDLDNL
jgi:hypothetical protein